MNHFFFFTQIQQSFAFGILGKNSFNPTLNSQGFKAQIINIFGGYFPGSVNLVDIMLYEESDRCQCVLRLLLETCLH